LKTGLQVQQTLRDTLVSAANATGGWGYYRGRASRIEPTIWALLALDAQKGMAPASLDPHIAYLTRSRDARGQLVDDAALPVNFGFNGQGAIALRTIRNGSVASLAGAVLDSLVLAKGVAVQQSPQFKQDNSLQGWAWMDGTFSWVEPTAWCALALKASDRRASPDAAARIQEAERLLLDRACVGGGWNFGNSVVLDQDLRPYVACTAIALLALQDKRADPVVATGWQWLRQHRLSESSGMALALTSMCARLYGEPANDVEARLRELASTTAFLGNLHVTAMALYALSADSHGLKAFRV
jgi:hypothetical protein